MEGFNSVFSKKFWNKLQFSDEQEIDVKIKDFNVAYEKYSQLVSNNPKIKEEGIKHIGDFKDVNLENKCVKHFKADKICFYGLYGERTIKAEITSTGSLIF